ncbi:MAG: MFS transporter [Barnesiella sp.]
MTKQEVNLRDSAVMRWSALGIVAFTMMAAYFVNDIMAPLKTMLESNLSWNSSDFGYFTGAYSFLNVFLLMLIWGGLMLDRFGIRLTGKLATILMVVGVALEYYGITVKAADTTMIMGHKAGVFFASAGYSIFGVGAEVAGITVTKIIAKWFRGKEMGTAMGIQVALARIGSQAAYSVAIPIAKNTSLSMPVIVGFILLVIGMFAFFAYSVMDKKLDKQDKFIEEEEESKFSFRDVKDILINPGFWLIALLCVLFYSCVFPFQKFASELMVNKYGISDDIAGTIVGLPALGALVLTPLFGSVVDRRGKAASIMMLGSFMLILVHLIYAIPFLNNWLIAITLMIVLGVAFSLVPSAMWPSVAKIFPARQLGTAYALIFFIQNIGLWGVPNLIGLILDKYCVVGTSGNANIYDYTLPMVVFTGFAVLSLIVAYLLKVANRRYGYNLEKPNISK